ncbi:hypothetical protein B0A67_14035 [Flavobacterium aquidurense]|nr:hypothetical protein B0A67_14035 [Flavobacterium aquidurense]
MIRLRLRFFQIYCLIKFHHSIQIKLTLLILKLPHSKNQNKINKYFTNFNNYLKVLLITNRIYQACFIVIIKNKIIFNGYFKSKFPG